MGTFDTLTLNHRGHHAKMVGQICSPEQHPANELSRKYRNYT